MASTCLFTGALLTPETNEEHTIPRSMGGRIRSRVVSNPKFNHDCGDLLDPHLKHPYELMLNKLAPLMASEHSPGTMEVTVPEGPKGLTLDPGGILRRRGLLVLERDPLTNRPTKAVASNEADLRALAKSLGKEDSLKVAKVPVTEASTLYKTFDTLSPEAEVSALKSALLSFDHALRGSKNPFTRRASLEGVRKFVADSVSSRTVNDRGCFQYCLGMQYDKIDLYRRLREGISLDPTPFEHALFVASNAARRCLDMVWIVFGIDPFGFRLSTDWWDEDLCLGIVNGVLRGTGVSAAIPLDQPLEPLCSPTHHRTHPGVYLNRAATDRMFGEVSGRRMSAYGRAVLLVEEGADELIIESFLDAAQLSRPEEKRVVDQVRARLCVMFGRRKTIPTFVSSVDEIIAARAASSPEGFLEQLIGSSDVDWAAVLSFYRGCLQSLCELHGLPGDVFSSSMDSGPAAPGRPLGVPPRNQS